MAPRHCCDAARPDATRRQCNHEDGPALPFDWRDRLERFFGRIAEEGFRPRQLVFAVRRYHRWSSADATAAAHAATARELWRTYGLGELRNDYPELRVRFFRETVFADGYPELAADLDRLVDQQREERIATQDLLGQIARLRKRAAAGSDEEFLLARMAYPYLGQSDPAELVTLQEGSLLHADLVVTREDAGGRAVRIRHAATPREVGHLQRLFLQSKLSIRFLPEHHYLVVLDERDFVVGGLLYLEEGETGVRIDRYVVARRRRRKGIGRLLVDEFCNRMAGRGVETVTIAYLYPRYHESLGFAVDHARGGMTRYLDPADAAAGEEPLPAELADEGD